MAMTREEAFQHLQQVDKIYIDLRAKRDRLLGDLPTGMPGYPCFESVKEISAWIVKRKDQIHALRAEIAKLEAGESDGEREILLALYSLGIRPQAD